MLKSVENDFFFEEVVENAENEEEVQADSDEVIVNDNDVDNTEKESINDI